MAFKEVINGILTSRIANPASSLTALLTASGFSVASGLQNFANDGAAAAGGIAINQLYRNGSVVMIRVS